VVGMVVGGVLGAVLGHASATAWTIVTAPAWATPWSWPPRCPGGMRHDGRAYHFTPRDEARDGCRYATMVVDGRKPHDVLACPAGRGDWTFRRT